MKEHYLVRMGSDGKYRFYHYEAQEINKTKEKQATKADIQHFLKDIRQKRDAFDKALLDYEEGSV